MGARARSLLIIAVVVLLDWATKAYVRAHVSPLDTIPVIPGFFNIIHVENPGAAFSMLSDVPGVWKTVFLISVSSIVLGVVGTMLFGKQSAKNNELLRTALALVFGGAIGNLWDRAFAAHHTVTDFLQFFFGSYEYPSFNAADSAIFCGAALMLIDLWRSRKPAAESGSSAAGRPQSSEVSGQGPAAS